ncbi:hypothetical protein BKA69DRAFT_1093566, partial [Paraphysoderma sedebokerense]
MQLLHFPNFLVIYYMLAAFLLPQGEPLAPNVFATYPKSVQYINSTNITLIIEGRNLENLSSGISVNLRSLPDNSTYQGCQSAPSITSFTNIQYI